MTPHRSTDPGWADYRESIGDRSGLFAALRSAFAPGTALYPGSYLDLSPSTAIPSVTYVDVDARAAQFFADEARVKAELEGRTAPGVHPDVRFLHADYTKPLSLPEQGFDLLISLYATAVWDSCRRYLRPGGLLLANASHGDASLAALDRGAELVSAVHARDGRYRLDRERLARYLVPKDAARADAALIRESGRGVGYTVPAFAYVFRVR